MTLYLSCAASVLLLHRAYVAGSRWVDRRRDQRHTGRRPR